MTNKSHHLPTHRPPTHPGEMLNEEFLRPADVSILAFSEAIGVSYPRLHGVVSGKRSMTTDTAQRVAAGTSTSPDYWLQLQFNWDLWHAQRDIPAEVKKIRPLKAFAKA